MIELNNIDLDLYEIKCIYIYIYKYNIIHKYSITRTYIVMCYELKI